MTNISHTKLLPYQSDWPKRFQNEKEILRTLFGSMALKIEHIGSTSIEGLLSKPIIDIAVLIKNKEDGDKFIEPLSHLGYWYNKVNSSNDNERYFFRKGEPTEFHLSIAYADRGSFWERQILFRDYLRNHLEARDEYARLKENLLKNDPTGIETYIAGKSEFVNKILQLAGSKYLPTKLK